MTQGNTAPRLSFAEPQRTLPAVHDDLSQEMARLRWDHPARYDEAAGLFKENQDASSPGRGVGPVAAPRPPGSADAPCARSVTPSHPNRDPGNPMPDPIPHSPNPPLTGRCVLVTGGTTGIGLAVAHLLVRQQARVFVVGRTPGTLEAAPFMPCAPPGVRYRAFRWTRPG